MFVHKSQWVFILLGLLLCIPKFSFAYIQGSGMPSGTGIMSLFVGNSKLIPKRWNLPTIVYNSRAGTSSALRQLEKKNVDFIIVLSPLSKKQLRQYKAIQIPLAVGGIVPIVHIQGIRSGVLTLDGEALYDIMTGQITFWDDPKIVAINANISLPHQQIMIIYPYPGSSYSFVLSHYLESINKDWNKHKELGSSFYWNNAGIESSTLNIRSLMNTIWQVRALPNSIGFIDYYYVNQLVSQGYGSSIVLTKMRNASNYVVKAGYKAFQAAVQKVQIKYKEDFISYIDHSDNLQAWPISGFIYVIVPLDSPQSSLTLSFFMWVLASTKSYFWQHFGYSAFPQSLRKEINSEVVQYVIRYNQQNFKYIIHLDPRIVGTKYASEVNKALQKQALTKTFPRKVSTNTKLPSIQPPPRRTIINGRYRRVPTATTTSNRRTGNTSRTQNRRTPTATTTSNRRTGNTSRTQNRRTPTATTTSNRRTGNTNGTQNRRTPTATTTSNRRTGNTNGTQNRRTPTATTTSNRRTGNTNTQNRTSYNRNTVSRTKIPQKVPQGNKGPANIVKPSNRNSSNNTQNHTSTSRNTSSSVQSSKKS